MYTWDPIRTASLDRLHSLTGPLAGRNASAVGGSRKISNIDHLDERHLSRSSRSKGRANSPFGQRKFKGLVEFLGFHPHGDWLLAAGGGDKDGFLTFLDLTAKKVLAQEKVPMYVHGSHYEKADTYTPSDTRRSRSWP